MQTNIINIGNSKGIRIPASLLKSLNIQNKVELITEKDYLIIKPIREKSRANWSLDAQKCHNNQDDLPLINDNLDIPKDWKW